MIRALSALILFLSFPVIAQQQSTAQQQAAPQEQQVSPNPSTGRKAAQRYFAPDTKPTAAPVDDERMLMLQFGNYISSEGYSWGNSSPLDQPGGLTYGLTYLLETWHGMDVNLRMDISQYNVSSNFAQKVSLLPLLTFPGLSTHFPLYFGAGVGGGVFLAQVPGKSALSLDYQLVVGARFLNLYQNTGAFVEVGMNNSFFLLSTGQIIAASLSTGLIFTF